MSGHNENNGDLSKIPLQKAEAELIKINPKIFEGLNRNKKVEVIKTFSYAVKVHSGPLPSSETLKEYEEVLPGSAQTIFDVFVKQSNHRMAMESTVVNAQQTQSKWGQNYAFIIAIVVLAAAFACILMGHEVSGSILGSVDLVALVTVFIVGKQYQKQNLDSKKPSEQKESK
jgi:uncharacterized membrane protein